MAEQLRRQGYFSVLRWRNDPTRDEAKNIAVVLVDPEGAFGGVRSVPPSSVGKALREIGLLDTMINSLAGRFEHQPFPTLNDIEKMHGDLGDSLVLSEPRPVVVKDEKETLEALYKAFLKPTGFSVSKALTKGAVIDLVARKLRRRGFKVKLAEYVDDFVFDAVVEKQTSRRPVVAEILSFATDRKDWIPMEHDAGHFLYAMDQVSLKGFAVVQPPAPNGPKAARKAHDRVLRWFGKEQVSVLSPKELDNGSFALFQ